MRPPRDLSVTGTGNVCPALGQEPQPARTQTLSLKLAFGFSDKARTKQPRGRTVRRRSPGFPSAPPTSSCQLLASSFQLLSLSDSLMVCVTIVFYVGLARSGPRFCSLLPAPSHAPSPSRTGPEQFPPGRGIRGFRYCGPDRRRLFLLACRGCIRIRRCIRVCLMSLSCAPYSPGFRPLDGLRLSLPGSGSGSELV